MAKVTPAVVDLDTRFALHTKRGASVCLVTFGSHINAGKVSTYAFFETIKMLLPEVSFDYLLFRPKENTWYLDGIPGLRADVENAAAKLRELNRGYRKTLYVGNSMGAYGALLYGVLAPATKVLAISPQTDVSAKFRHEIGDARWKTDIDLINAELKPAEFSIASLLASHRDAKVEIDVHYGVRDNREIAHAKAVSSDKRVHPIPHEEGDHDLAHALRADGRLLTLLRDGLA